MCLALRLAARASENRDTIWHRSHHPPPSSFWWYVNSFFPRLLSTLHMYMIYGFHAHERVHQLSKNTFNSLIMALGSNKRRFTFALAPVRHSLELWMMKNRMRPGLTQLQKAQPLRLISSRLVIWSTKGKSLIRKSLNSLSLTGSSADFLLMFSTVNKTKITFVRF